MNPGQDGSRTRWIQEKKDAGQNGSRTIGLGSIGIQDNGIGAIGIQDNRVRDNRDPGQ